MAGHIHSHHFFLQLFGNKEVDMLYFATALIQFADGLISVFIPVYLWELGMPLWQILFFYFLRSVYYLGALPILLPLIKRLSDKMLMFLGIPTLILYFMGIEYIEVYPWLFYVLPLGVTLHILFYYLGYHANFSRAADGDHVGEEVGTSMMIASLVRFVTPFIGGVLIGTLGFNYTFIIASIVLLFSTVPLMIFSKRNVGHDFNLKRILRISKEREFKPLQLSRYGYAIERIMLLVPWPLFLYLVVGNIEELGGIMSAGLLLGAVVTFLAGKFSDTGRRRKILGLGSAGASLTWLVRLGLQHPWALAGNHVLYQGLRDAVMASWTSTYYKVLRKVPNPSEFVIHQEIIDQIARIGILIIAMIAAYTLPLPYFFVLTFFIGAGGALLAGAARKQNTH